MPDGPVPVSDLEIADRILRAAATGPPRDREPTVAQLLSAFGEAEPTDAARQRVAAALTMAGATVAPDLLTTAPDDRVRLAPPHQGGRLRSPAARAGVGAAIIAGLIAVAVVASKHTGSSRSAQSALPPGPTTTTRAAPATATATAPTRTTDAPTTSTRPATTPKKKPPARHTHHHHAAPSVVRRGVVVRLTPIAPAYVCVDNGRGKVLFNGTLSAPLRFSGHHIRVNLGQSTIKLTVNGKPVDVTQSPSGYDINIHHVHYIPAGKRPCA